MSGDWTGTDVLSEPHTFCVTGNTLDRHYVICTTIAVDNSGIRRCTAVDSAIKVIRFGTTACIADHRWIEPTGRAFARPVGSIHPAWSSRRPRVPPYASRPACAG